MKTLFLALGFSTLLAFAAFVAADPRSVQDLEARSAEGRAEPEKAARGSSYPVPEGTLALASMGLLALGAARRRMKG